MSLTKLCGAFVLESAVLCVAIILAHGTRPAQAGGVVTECTDAGLTQALADGGNVTFNCPGPEPQTILITSSKMITLATYIDGKGVIVLDGQGATHFFSVYSSLELNGLTLTHGRANSGGAIFNASTLILRRSLIAWNTAYYSGGGVENHGYVSIEDSTFIGNEATARGYFNGAGGGLFNNGTAVITNSTFISNVAASPYGGGLATSPDVIIINSTFIGNHGHQIAGVSMNMTNTLLGGGPSGDCGFNLNLIGSNNLSSDASCAFTGPDNQINTHPRLGPLVYFGAGVPTYSLLPDSPAIDAGTNAGCPMADQRGFARPFGARCDIGAFEWHAPFANARRVPIFWW